MSEATEALLAAYRDDLQRLLGRSAVVEGLFAREAFGLTTLVATISIGSRPYQLTGTGENCVTAYADLVRRAPEPVLGDAYRELLDSMTRSRA